MTEQEIAKKKKRLYEGFCIRQYLDGWTCGTIPLISPFCAAVKSKA